MKADTRRANVLEYIKHSTQPLSASALAKQLGVSRQIIVGDIAILRASGHEILATPKGYLINAVSYDGLLTKTIACRHLNEKTKDEIYTIVDNGGTLVNVIVEHPIYGQLAGELHISSRYDAENFFKKVEEDDIMLLSALTDGLHLHTIKCRTEADFERIKSELRKQNILFENQAGE